MKKKLVFLFILLMVVLSLQASIRSEAIEWLKRHNISQEWIVVIISMLPVIELRGAIPVGIFMFEFGWLKAALLSVFGNMIPIPFVLLFMDAFVAILRKTKLGCSITEWLFKRTRNKGKIIEKYEAAGLIIFVGIPLPGTGGWTGAFASKLFGLKFWKSLLFIFIGVILAAIVVTLLCQTGVIILG